MRQAKAGGLLAISGAAETVANSLRRHSCRHSYRPCACGAVKYLEEHVMQTEDTRNQKTRLGMRPRRVLVSKKSGDTYFRTCSTIIGSECLTTVFGMGTGVTTPICSPEGARRVLVKTRPRLVICNSG